MKIIPITWSDQDLIAHALHMARNFGSSDQRPEGLSQHQATTWNDWFNLGEKSNGGYSYA